VAVYGVTPDGFVIKPLSVILSEINDQQLLEVDPGLDQDPRSPLQQINQTHGERLANVWEALQAAYGAAYPDSANDASLDNVSSITGTVRDKNTKTTVAGVLVTMAPNDPLPAGSVANLTSQPNARFVSDVEVPGNPAGGTFAVDFTAESAGATVVIVGQLAEIAEPVPGWLSVSNPAAGVTGTATESDSELREKRVDELEAQGSTNVNSIRADLRKVDAVVDAAVFENDTDTPNFYGRGLTPHSVFAVLRGGAAADIAQALFDTKAAGIATNGTEVEAVLDSQGVSHDIRFDFGTELIFHADITVVTDPLVFDGVDGPDAIKDVISAYVNAGGMGDDVIYDTVKSAVLPVPGIDDCGIPGVKKISALLIGFGAPSGTVDLPVADTEFASSDVANIAVTVT
jgi:uncharacterized phage protein gp47/JayE